MLHKILLPILAAAALVFAVRHVVQADQEPPKQPPPVEPARNPYRGTIAGSGVIESRTENIAVGSHVSGIVDKVFVEVGDEVQVGTPLFRLDDRQLKAELAMRQAALDSAKASLQRLRGMPRPEEIPASEARVREAKAIFDDALDQLDRAKSLVQSRAIAEEEYVRRKHAVTVATAQVDRAEADLRLLKKGAWEADIAVSLATINQMAAQVQQTRTELDRIEVRSPIRGRVLQRNIRSGEFVGNTTNQAFMMLGDVSQLHVRMDIDENDILRFRPGMRGKATPRGDATREIPLKFIRVEPLVVPKKALSGAGTERVDTRVLQVIYEMDKNESGLFVGQQLNVYLDTTSESPSKK